MKVLLCPVKRKQFEPLKAAINSAVGSGHQRVAPSLRLRSWSSAVHEVRLAWCDGVDVREMASPDEFRQGRGTPTDCHWSSFWASKNGIILVRNGASLPTCCMVCPSLAACFPSHLTWHGACVHTSVVSTRFSAWLSSFSLIVSCRDLFPLYFLIVSIYFPFCSPFLFSFLASLFLIRLLLVCGCICFPLCFEV